MSKSTISYDGFGCAGIIIAGMLSVKLYGWTWWIILHAMFNWFYLAYWLIFQSGLIKGVL
jgi:hypothetical protein